MMETETMNAQGKTAWHFAAQAAKAAKRRAIMREQRVERELEDREAIQVHLSTTRGFSHDFD